jgi:hypothetical protein
MQICAQARRGSTGAHEEEGFLGDVSGARGLKGIIRVGRREPSPGDNSRLYCERRSDSVVGNVICRDCLPPPSRREHPKKRKRLLTSDLHPFSIFIGCGHPVPLPPVDYKSAASSNRSRARKTPIYAGVKANRYECRRSSSGCNADAAQARSFRKPGPAKSFSPRAGRKVTGAATIHRSASNRRSTSAMKAES